MPNDDNSQLNIPANATDEQKTRAYSDYFGVPLVRLKDKDLPLAILEKIPYEVSKSFDIIAYEFDSSKTPAILKIAVGEASRLQKKAPAILSEIKKQKNVSIELAVTTRQDFDFALNRYKKLLDNPKLVESKTSESAKNGKTSFPMIDLREIPIPYQVLTKFPEEVAVRYQIVVFEASSENKIKVAAVNPHDIKVQDILDFVKKRNNIEIEIYETTPSSLSWAIRGYKNVPKSSQAAVPAPLPEQPKPPVAKHEEIKPPSEPIAPEIKKEQPGFVQKETIQKPVEPEKIVSNNHPSKLTGPLARGQAPEIKIEDISFSGMRGGNDKQLSQTQLEATSEEAERNLDKILPNGINSVSELETAIKSGFIPKTLAAIIYYAVLEGASDVHIESDQKIVRLRYRIDGILKDVIKVPLELLAPIVSRIKILSKLKIDETRIPQDGRFESIVKGKEIDLRVSTLPTIHGEKAVLRILDKSSQLLGLEELGVVGNAFKVLDRNIKKPYGVILSTGPTGSGKTTTLYSIINKINNPEINIVTLEDPVEYEIPNVNQCQIKPKIGFGFADGLRSILRQDPNIIMVGEIRDQETASMATHAALTGHLVLSTLHTNDASSALPRLINMGVEPFLITSAINCIMAQRLVRKICPKCREEYKIPEATVHEIKEYIDKSQNAEIKAYANKDIKFFRGKGCDDCVDGYKGRIGIFEVLEMTDKIENLAVTRAPATAIREQAIKDGMLTMKEDGMIKIFKGITTIDEVLRVTAE